MDINNNGTNNISNNGVNNLPPEKTPNVSENNVAQGTTAFTVEEIKPESIVNVPPVQPVQVNQPEFQNVNPQPVNTPEQNEQSMVVEPYVPKQENIVPNPTVEEQIIQPTENTIMSDNNMTIVDTEKKKTSSVGIILLVIILVLFVVFIDPITEIIETNFISKDPVSVNNSTGNNLVNGYVMIDDNNGFIKVEEIRFYNFKKTGNNNILLNYESSKKYDDVSTLNIYIELYTSEKQLLYKDLFVPTESISKDTIRTYNINVDADVYEKAYYALVKIYTEEEKNKTSVVNCKFLETTENYNLVYDINYNFVNDGLVSYSVDKKIEVINLTNEVRLYMDELNNENTDLTFYSIQSDFDQYQLMYIIDLNESNNGYIPLYKKDTTPYIIKNKETIKKWICE